MKKAPTTKAILKRISKVCGESPQDILTTLMATPFKRNLHLFDELQRATCCCQTYGLYDKGKPAGRVIRKAILWSQILFQDHRALLPFVELQLLFITHKSHHLPVSQNQLFDLWKGTLPK